MSGFNPDGFGSVNPGQTSHMFDDHLSQLRHKGDHATIVDHMHYGSNPVEGAHVVMEVDRNGNVAPADFEVKKD